MKTKLITLLIIIILLFGQASPARAVGLIIYVKWDAVGANNGISWADAYTDLQSALSAAVSSDQIWVSAGTYKPTTSTDRMLNFTLKNGVAIYGGFAGTETLLSQRNPTVNVTILSGDIGTVGNASDNSYHVVVGGGTNNTAVLDGFTITVGNANGSYPDNGGGGMYNAASSPTLANLIFNANSGAYGGGMSNYNSSPTLTNVTFSANTASPAGGGIYNKGSSPTLTNVTFSTNTVPTSGAGGGIYNYQGSSPMLTNVTFSNNSGGAGGGMVNYTDCNSTLTNVTFSSNHASNIGGGMYNYNSSATLINVTFAGNTSASDGAGMISELYLYLGSSLSLTHVTFSGNSVTSGKGGGIYSYSNYSGNSLALTDVIFSANSATWGGGMYNQSNSSPSLTDVTFTNNTSAGDGGGMYNSTLSGSSPTLTNVTFNGNTSGLDGGGMYNSAYQMTMTNVNFLNNTTYNSGGGLITTSVSTTLTNVTFNGNKSTWVYGEGGGIYIQGTTNNSVLTNVTLNANTAAYGGGMYNAGIPTLTNLTFNGNIASASGGGIYNYSNSSPTLTNVTFSNNTAPVGGAISHTGNSLGTGNLTIQDSIFWNDSSEIYYDSGTITLTDDIVAGGCPSGSTCTNVINADPVLGTLQNNGGFTETMALGAGSAAIDAGNNATCASTDQRGIPRPVGVKCDLGAYEAGYVISGNAGVAGATLSYTDGTPKTAMADGSGNYTFTVSYNWSGIVTPSKTSYIFSPTSRTYSNVAADQTAQDYTAITHTLFLPFIQR